jgi:ParB-like chromosome segregation protein Spo0J
MLYDIQSIRVKDRRRTANTEKVRAIAASIAEIGLINPITIRNDGTLIAGLHRLEAHKALGLAQIEAKVLDLDPLDAELAEIDENLQRNDLTVLEQGEHLFRRNQILEEKGQRAKAGDNQYLGGETVSPPKPTAEIAADMGLSERSAQQRQQIARDLLPEVKEVIRDLPIADSTTQLLTLARLEPSQQMQAAEKLAAQRAQRMSVTVYSSESNEWYTPAWVTARAADVMGNIDLDPASSQIAQQIHSADAWYGLDHPDPNRRDGLAAEWNGCVWLNPPYGRSEDGHNAQLWSRKLINEWKAGRVESGILLVKAALGYNWFEDLWRELPVCFLRERLSFVRPDGTDDGQSKQATALFYVGDDIEQFAGVFAKYGRVVLPET